MIDRFELPGGWTDASFIRACTYRENKVYEQHLTVGLVYLDRFLRVWASFLPEKCVRRNSGSFSHTSAGSRAFFRVTIFIHFSGHLLLLLSFSLIFWSTFEWSFSFFWSSFKDFTSVTGKGPCSQNSNIFLLFVILSLLISTWKHTPRIC